MLDGGWVYPWLVLWFLAVLLHGLAWLGFVSEGGRAGGFDEGVEEMVRWVFKSLVFDFGGMGD